MVNRLLRGRPRVTPIGRTLLMAAVPRGRWVAPPGHEPEWADSSRVEILARTGYVRQRSDWQYAFDDALRLYHLHYLDQLCATQQPEPFFPASLLDRWIAENPRGSRPGWEPYPLSRRLVNVFKSCLRGELATPDVLVSLAAQCRHLMPRLEYHLLANHLLANAKALTFAGLFFEGAEAQGWLKQGLKLLRRELPEQIGADGGHFERSPMYHAIVLSDVLDLLNLSRCFGNRSLEELVLPHCTAMLGWLAELCHPDGDIAFFNDTALGVAARFDDLASYAARLAVIAAPAQQRTSKAFIESAFVRLRVQQWHALLDVGGPAPAYQPGHAHAGTLSFELSHAACRVFVNSGISTYETGPTRARERGTGAHNALTLDLLDSSEVWQSFRVGARARVTSVAHGGDALSAWASATHDGYRRTKFRALHTRRWHVSVDALEITDTIEGMGAPSIETSLHLHPDCVAEFQSPLHVRIAAPDQTRFNLHLDGQQEWRIEDYVYSRGFGQQRRGQVIRGVTRKQLPLATFLRLDIQR